MEEESKMSKFMVEFTGEIFGNLVPWNTTVDADDESAAIEKAKKKVSEHLENPTFASIKKLGFLE
jgi:hypothetical protein